MNGFFVNSRESVVPVFYIMAVFSSVFIVLFLQMT